MQADQYRSSEVPIPSASMDMMKSQPGRFDGIFGIRDRKWVWLIIIFVAAWFVRYLCWRQDPVICRDGATYLLYVKQYAAGKRDFSTSMLFPMLINWLQKCSGLSTLDSALLLNITAGSCLVPLLFLSAEKLFVSRFAQWSTALLTMAHPSLIRWSADILRENLYLLFSSLFLYSALCFIHRSRGVYAFFCGFFGLLGCLSRSEMFEVIPIIAVVLFFPGFFLPNWNWRLSVKFLGIAFIGSTVAFLLTCYLGDFDMSILQTPYQKLLYYVMRLAK